MANKKPPIYAVIGQRIRARRDWLGMTQERLAEAVGLTRTSITNIEAGRQECSVLVLYRIAQALRGTVEQFVKGI